MPHTGADLRINLTLLDRQQHLTWLITPSCRRHSPESGTPVNIDSSYSFSVHFAGLSFPSMRPQSSSLNLTLMPPLLYLLLFCPLTPSTDPLAVPPPQKACSCLCTSCLFCTQLSLTSPGLCHTSPSHSLIPYRLYFSSSTYRHLTHNYLLVCSFSVFPYQTMSSTGAETQ